MIFVHFKLNSLIMKIRIANNLLKMYQSRALTNKSPYLQQFHSIAYSLIQDMITDVKRPFTNICIHGRYPELIIPFIHRHNQRFNILKKDTNITLVDHVRNASLEELYNQGQVKEVRYLENGDSWLYQEESFDLLLTSLRTHYSNSQEELFRKYHKTLKPDGALIGSSIVEGTLSELYWAYLMAQNQRHGGMSPKVLQAPSLGQLGSAMTMAKYHMATILSHDSVLQLESVVDLLTLLQELGQSGYLRGRRKGVYKDLLLAVSALYSSQFDNQHQNIRATLALGKFIAWKYHESQPKSLSPGPHVGSVQFSQELKKYGDEVETFVIQQGVQDPKKLK